LITNKTVVVVAAGASHDVKMPLGPGLQENIANMLRPDVGVYRHLEGAAANRFKDKDRLHAISIVERASSLTKQLLSAASIDNFLDQHKDERELVDFFKITIAYALADAEKRSALSNDYSTNESSIIGRTADYFLHDFMNIVMRGHQADNVADSMANLTFVIFNYDRCVERYLDLWMRFRFGPDFAWQPNAPKMIHVYGSLGDYFDSSTFNPFTYNGKYAFQNPHLELPQYADKIKVFTEQEDSVVQQEILNSIHTAQALIFLGFGFEEQNMRFFEGKWDSKRVFATTLGMSDPNQVFIKEKLTNQFSDSARSVFTLKGKSRALLSDLYHPLTSAVGSI